MTTADETEGRTVTGWDAWFATQRATREQAGLQRTLHPRAATETTVDLAGNDYLGLRHHLEVCRAAADAVWHWGAGAGASRLVTGTTTLHAELERELADFTGHAAGLVFSTGYQANLAAVTALVGRDGFVVSDAHVHASLIDAARLSRATVEVVAHNDVAAVRRALSAAAGQPSLVLTESVFSVLGDTAPLRELANVCAAHDALLVVDEAHGLGVAGDGGTGLVAEAGLARHPNVVVTATLSKALGAMGGVVFGSPVLLDHVTNRARPFVFDTALAPAPTAGALAAVQTVQDHPELPVALRRRGDELATRLDIPPTAGAVHPVPMPSPQAAVACQARLARAGVRVGCFRPPSVPDGVSRLRVTVRADLDETAWQHALTVLADACREHGSIA